jgi:hypothetical protein
MTLVGLLVLLIVLGLASAEGIEMMLGMGRAVRRHVYAWCAALTVLTVVVASLLWLQRQHELVVYG